MRYLGTLRVSSEHFHRGIRLHSIFSCKFTLQTPRSIHYLSEIFIFEVKLQLNVITLANKFEKGVTGAIKFGFRDVINIMNIASKAVVSSG